MKKWDNLFLRMCVLVASKSEDQSTKCGAVIVGDDNAVLSVGYNGFPRGVQNLPERNERPIKYSYFEHSERNAIFNAASNGIRLKGTRMYITGLPCCDCARAIIQSGIKEIVMPVDPGQDEFEKRWAESLKVSTDMLAEAGVNIRRA